MRLRIELSTGTIQQVLTAKSPRNELLTIIKHRLEERKKDNTFLDKFINKYGKRTSGRT